MAAVCPGLSNIRTHLPLPLSLGITQNCHIFTLTRMLKRNKTQIPIQMFQQTSTDRLLLISLNRELLSDFGVQEVSQLPEHTVADARYQFICHGVV